MPLQGQKNRFGVLKNCESKTEREKTNTKPNEFRLGIELKNDANEGTDAEDELPGAMSCASILDGRDGYVG